MTSVGPRFRGIPCLDPICVGDGFSIHPPASPGDPLGVTPSDLVLGTTSNGDPDFHLELVTGEIPTQPPDPYGVLEMRLEARYPLERAKRRLAELKLSGEVAPLALDRGFLLLHLASQSNAGDPLWTRTELAWNGLGRTRLVHRMTPAGAVMLRDAIREAELFTAEVIAWTQLRGWSPRIEARVEIRDLRQLAQRLIDEVSQVPGASSAHLSHQRLVCFFQETPDILAVEPAPAEEESARLARAVADRFRMAFLQFDPPDGANGNDPCLSLELAQVPAEPAFWDLREPFEALRPQIHCLHQIEAARRLGNLGHLYHETRVPAIGSGSLLLDVHANLPPGRLSPTSLHVDIEAPPSPFRPQAIRESVKLIEPEDRGRVTLAFSPLESPAYAARVRAEHFDAKTGVLRRVIGERWEQEGDQLYVQLSRVPLSFCTIEIGPSLAALAEVELKASWRPADSEALVSDEYRVDGVTQPVATLAVPHDSSERRVAIRLLERGGEGRIDMDDSPFSSLYLDINDLPTARPQHLSIRLSTTLAQGFFSLEILPEGCRPEEVSALLFTAEVTEHEAAWTPLSPFHPNLLYRPYLGPDEAAQEWRSTTLDQLREGLLTIDPTSTEEP